MNKGFIGIVFLLFAVNANGAGLLGFAPSPSEMAMLPDYCKAKAAGPGSPEYEAWADRLGRKYERTFGGFHHVCSGINQMNRYLRLINDPKRGYYLSRAVPEIDYIAAHMPDDFPLAGEIYFQRGLANQLMHEEVAATGDFFKAIQHDPNHVQAYLRLTDIYINTGNKNKALEIVTSGLKRVPASKAMQRRYLSLGGKEPLPVAPPTPMTASQQNEQSATDKTTTGIENNKPAEVAVEKKPPTDQKDGIKNNPGATDKKVGGADAKAKNPYCRFCP